MLTSRTEGGASGPRARVQAALEQSMAHATSKGTAVRTTSRMLSVRCAQELA
jgi:hypothetical protein